MPLLRFKFFYNFQVVKTVLLIEIHKNIIKIILLSFRQKISAIPYFLMKFLQILSKN